MTLPCRAPTIWLAEDQGRIVGGYCGTPIRLRPNGAPIEAIHGSDAMTLPAYWRQGILTAAASTAARDWVAAGYRLKIGVVWRT